MHASFGVQKSWACLKKKLVIGLAHAHALASLIKCAVMGASTLKGVWWGIVEVPSRLQNRAQKGLHAQVLSRYCPGIQKATRDAAWPMQSQSMSQPTSRLTSQNGGTRPARIRGGRVAFVPPPGHMDDPWYPDWTDQTAIRGPSASTRPALHDPFMLQ